MPTALDRLAQDDWALGVQRDVAPHLIDARGAFDITNGLVDDDGSIYRRGGATFKSSAFGTGLRLLWDGYLKPGRRTVFASTSDYGVLDSDDATPINLGGSGRGYPMPVAELGGILFLPGGAIYGGSRLLAPYSTGTVSVTNGSKTVTIGSGFTGNVDAGMLLRISTERVYVVESVDSDTQLTLEDAYQGSTNAAASYTLSPFLDAPGAPYTDSSILAVCADRLCWAVDNEVRYGTPDDPHAAHVATHVQTMPEGVRVLGLSSIGQVLIVFTTGGVFVIRGLYNTNPQDNNGNPQHRVERVTADLVLFGAAGIATWENALVVPCIDGIYLIDGTSGPVAISHPIVRLYRDYVTAGYRPGSATVFRGHYFLPILSADASTVQDVLVCRLDRPSRSRSQRVFPWTRFRELGAQVSCYAVRAGSPIPDPILLGALATGASPVTSRLIEATSYFQPNPAYKNDPDDTVHKLTIITRDYPTAANAPGREGTARRAEWRYELVDAGADNPTLILSYSLGEKVLSGSLWGSMVWGSEEWAANEDTVWTSVQGSAPENDGLDPFKWHVNKRGRYIRFKLESSGPSAKLNVRSLELFIRSPRTLRN